MPQRWNSWPTPRRDARSAWRRSATASSAEAESCEGIGAGNREQEWFLHKDKCTKAKETRQIEACRAFEQARAESHEHITSDPGIPLRLNRSIQSEGAFGVLKEDRHFRRLKRRGTDQVFTEILLYAFAYDVEKFHAKTQQGQLKTMLFIPDTASLSGSEYSLHLRHSIAAGES